jgi:uncharacterized protein (TIGR00369 family)
VPGRQKAFVAGLSKPRAIVKKPNSSSVVYEPEFIAGLKLIFEEKICFNRVLGLRIDRVSPTEVSCHMAMHPDLIGHYGHQRLHGGVIASCMDGVAGLAVMAALGAKHMDEPIAKRLNRFDRLGTIDMRVDYLRQAIGARFEVRAQVLRLGSRVDNLQMSFWGPGEELVATGAAAFIVS